MMKLFLKIMLFVGMLGIFSACGPVTLVPSITPTKKASPSPTATQAPFAPSFAPSGGPEKGIDSYQLRGWGEKDYEKLVRDLDDMVGDKDGEIPYMMVTDYLVALQLERLLKFPDSSTRDDVVWQILFENPNISVIPGIGASNDITTKIIADILKQGISLDKLSAEIEKHGWLVTETMMVDNIVGNGEKGMILMVKIPNNDGLTGIFAVFRQGDQFKVKKIHDWDVSQAPALGRYFALKDVGDTNGNGLPEIIIEIETGGSGMPQIGKKEIEHIEWSNQRNKFNHQSFPVYWQTCDEFGDGPCAGDVEFSKKDSLPVLITRSHWYTQKDCPTFAIQRNAEWDGEKYAPRQPEIVPPVSDLTPECRLAWAETAIELRANDWDGGIKESGWRNDLAISIVEKSAQSWTDLADEWWGPAGRDFFKLRLGIWYELRGQDDKAKSTLQSLAAQPHLKDFDLASRLAKIYIEERAVSGPARACLSLDDAYFAEYRQAVPEPSFFNDNATLIQSWGFVKGKGSLCNVIEMVPADVQTARLTSKDALESWLQKTGFTVYQDKVLYLNTDGIEDHLILLDTTDSESPDAWVFLSTPDGYHAAYIRDLWAEDEYPKMDIYPINTGDGKQVHLIALEEDVVIFLIQDDVEVQILLEEYGVQSFQIKSDAMPAEVLLNVDNFSYGKKTVSYIWGMDLSNFFEQDKFKLAQIYIEKMLYAEQDYSAVIAYIDDFLQETHQEPYQAYVCGTDIPNDCLYRPAWYIPYFYYLRGLAYEQMGQTDKAKQAYYDIWQDYPTNVFGMAAQLKLEPIP